MVEIEREPGDVQRWLARVPTKVNRTGIIVKSLHDSDEPRLNSGDAFIAPSEAQQVTTDVA